MLGWLRAATPRMDSSNCSRNDGDAASLGRTSFNVTVRPDSSSRASYTAVLAPVPSRRSTRKRSANKLPTRSAGSNARGGDVSPGATMPARYRLTPRRLPHSRAAHMCRSRPPPGIMELVTEANTAAENEAKTRADDEVDQAANEEPQPSRKRFDKTTLALSLLIAIGLVLVGRGLAVSLTGDARAKLPDTIEEVDPYPEAVQVLSQTRVFVDLDAGYT